MGQNKLYLIGTPLGNLEDITLRAQSTLRDTRHLFAEDTRETAKLLGLIGISLNDKKLHSYSSHNMKEATEKALRLLAEGESIGLVSDRGMPAISDPGAVLVQAAREAGTLIVPIPGPSAVTTAFSVAGTTETGFHFVGFLPSTQKQRDELWDQAKTWPEPLCFYESPKRIQKTLAELASKFPMGKVFLAREMTKQFEEFLWFDLNQDPAPWDSVKELGEFTVILIPGEKKTTVAWEEELRIRLLPEKEWAKAVAAKAGIAASEIYNALQRLKKH